MCDTFDKIMEINMVAGRKNGKYLNICIDADIYDRLEAYCEAVGQKKTAAVERILTDYLDRFDKDPEGTVLIWQKEN